MTSSYSKTFVFVFVRPHVNEKPAFSKLFTLESVYKKMLFWRPFTSVDGRPNRRKNFRFKNIRNLYHVIKFSLSCRCLLVIRFLQKKLVDSNHFHPIRISSNSFYLMIIVNWHLTFTVCPKPDSKFL